MLAVLLLTGCGEEVEGDGAAASPNLEPQAQDSAKRVEPGDPCELISGDELSRIVGSPEQKSAMSGAEGPQCFYDFEDGTLVTTQRGAAAARGGEPTEIAGVSAREMQVTSDTCVVDVMLKPGDEKQIVGASGRILPKVSDREPCDLAQEVATKIYEDLPG